MVLIPNVVNTQTKALKPIALSNKSTWLAFIALQTNKFRNDKISQLEKQPLTN